MGTISAEPIREDHQSADPVLAATRERCARLEAALAKALPYVERVAATCPTEPRRQERQREATKLAADLRLMLAKAVTLNADEAAQFGKLHSSNPSMLSDELARFEAQAAKSATA